MTGDKATDSHRADGWRCVNVWAHSDAFASNSVRQLLVPASVFSVVSGNVGALEVHNNYGTWPAASTDRPLGLDLLWARLPLGAKPGDALTRASWDILSTLTRLPPSEVLETYRSAITFNEGTSESPGLRPPQLGAMHAVLGYWTTKRTTPATVVMPTGTGKTETMLALLVAAGPRCLLISFEEYQRLKGTEPLQLPPEIEHVVEDSRRHPERDQPRPRRAVSTPSSSRSKPATARSATARSATARSASARTPAGRR